MNPKIRSKKLHIGCGQKYFKGWFNIDGFSDLADAKLDFDKTPWNLPSNYFEEIYCSHVIEHVKDVQSFMDEIWRVCKKNAKVTIIAPHFSSMSAPSPFHLHNFNSQSMSYFTGNKESYGRASFELRNVKIYWYPSTDQNYINQSTKRKIVSYIGKLLDIFINFNRHFFERIWCYYVGGAFEIKWELEAKK